jgi:hypothetical protein
MPSGGSNSTTCRAIFIVSLRAGLKGSGDKLTGAVFMPVTISGADAVAAARISGLKGSPIGTWYITKPISEPSTIGAVNDVARARSNWGGAAQPGSDAARTRDAVQASRQETAAIACVAAPAKSKVGSKPPSDPSQCKLVMSRDVI